MIKLKKGTEFKTGVKGHEYVSVSLCGLEREFSTIIEITDKSYEKYNKSRKSKETLIRLLSKQNKKILLFHNAQYGIDDECLKYEKDIHIADLLVCCNSLFLSPELRRKVILKSPLSVRTETFESRGRKFLKIISATEGFILKDKFKEDETELLLDTLIQRI